MTEYQLGWLAIVGCLVGIACVLGYACVRLSATLPERPPRPGAGRSKGAVHDSFDELRDRCAAHHQRVASIGNAIDAQLVKLKEMNDELEAFQKMQAQLRTRDQQRRRSDKRGQ